MRVSGELLNRIIRSLRSDSGGQFGGNNRKGPRVGLRGNVNIHIEQDRDGKHPFSVGVRNISQTGGLGLVCPHELPEGLRFVAIFPCENFEYIRILYNVTNCREVLKDTFWIGARVVEVLKNPLAPPAPVNPPAAQPQDPAAAPQEKAA